jgi:hypothetical protein
MCFSETPTTEATGERRFELHPQAADEIAAAEEWYELRNEGPGNVSSAR